MKFLLPWALALMGVADAAAAPATASLAPCQLPGVASAAQCGQIARPLDPARPDGPQIAVHFAMLPALARHKKPDPVFFFAGGPGQSAIDLAGPMGALMARLGNRRDIVLIDQRGTGRSAPLVCDGHAPTQSLRERLGIVTQQAALQRCLAALQALPHGDLRQYTTSIAMADADAVRQALGAAQVNLVGASYGTRAALEYQRQFPQAVRRAVLDGVAPPDMVLPASIAADGQAAFDALLQACAGEPACAGAYPDLRGRWRAALATLPQAVTVPHPVTGQPETLTLTPEMAAGLLRLPLYLPALAAGLPAAIDAAAQGRWAALFGLSSAMTGRRAATDLAQGMHFSVVCAEDMPRLDEAPAAPPGDLGPGFVQGYRDACAGWPRGAVPPAFYTVPPAPAATLVFSGGLDPVTPPRHGERVVQALGAKAHHVVVPQAGHGVLALPCHRDVLFRFIDADTDAAALQVDAGCAQAVPRPPAFQPVRPAPEAAQ